VIGFRRRDAFAYSRLGSHFHNRLRSRLCPRVRPILLCRIGLRSVLGFPLSVGNRYQQRVGILLAHLSFLPVHAKSTCTVVDRKLSRKPLDLDQASERRACGQVNSLQPQSQGKYSAAKSGSALLSASAPITPTMIRATSMCDCSRPCAIR
jgi:hypothetical protein